MSKSSKLIFILLIVVCMACAAMAAIGFIGKEREYTKRLVVEDKLAATLKDKRNIEKELEAAKSAKEVLETKITKFEEKAKELISQLDEEKQKSETATAELETKEIELAKIKTELDSEKKERFDISNKLEMLQTDYDKVKKEALRLANEKIDLEKKVTELREKTPVNLDKIVVNTGITQTQKPIMQGTVLVVNKDYGFIVTDIGQDKNIQKGAKFDVMDGGKLLGKAEIEKVYDTMSSATILPGSKIDDMKKGNVIIESR